MFYLDTICSCTIFLAQILLIRPWPKVQPTINICREWVKELSLSEPIRSNAWIILLPKMNTRMELHCMILFLFVLNTVFPSPSLRDSLTLYSSPHLISTLHLLII